MCVPRVIEIAVEHCQAGRLADAEELHHQILTVNSNHFNARHLLGVLAHQSGKHQKATELIAKRDSAEPHAAPSDIVSLKED